MTEETSVRRHLVGAALRRYRENLALPLEDAAQILECDRSKISRIESGLRGIRPKELRELLTEYGVPEPEQAALAGLVSRSGRHGWWDQYTDLISEGSADFLVMESAAAEIMVYDPQLVPPLLQTPDYARAIAAAQPGYDTGDQREQAVAASAARQDAILGGSRQLAVIMSETALRQQVGGPPVMAGQIGRLAEVARNSPGITLQVLPFSAGAHAAARSASYSILRFGGAPNLGVVHLESLSGGVFVDGQPDVACYTRAFALLRACALTAEQTRQLLDELCPPWE